MAQSATTAWPSLACCEGVQLALGSKEYHMHVAAKLLCHLFQETMRLCDSSSFQSTREVHTILGNALMPTVISLTVSMLGFNAPQM